MRTNRLYVDMPLSTDIAYQLPPEAAHYVARVLRLKAGAPLILFNGRGGEYDARVERVAGQHVLVRTEVFRALDRESPLSLRLAQGISRGERMGYAIQKAVELGVSRIQPLLTEYGVVRLAVDRAARRVHHWRGIAVNACEQCGRTRVPVMAPITALSEWLAREELTGLKLVMDPGAPRDLSAVEYTGGPVTLLVGPEGGLSGTERRMAAAAGFLAVALGPRILRTETAAVTGLAAIQLRWGDLGRRTS